MKDIKTIINEANGISVTLNKFAGQANGVWVQQGGTVVLASVTHEKTTDFPGFFPLSVDYRAHFAAVGKIPGGYFKREGKPTDQEVLSGRIIDRTMRPLFPKNFFDKVHVMVTVYSIDTQYLPLSLAVFAASLAVSLSEVAFLEPTACCELGFIDGKWVAFPSGENVCLSQAKLIVAGTKEGINMVEGAFDGLTEAQVLDGMFIGHEEIKKNIEFQNKIIRENQSEKESVRDVFRVAEWMEKADVFLNSMRVRGLFFIDKQARNIEREALFAQFIVDHKETIEAEKMPHSILEYAFDAVLQEKITKEIIALKTRTDGRKFDEVRSIETEVNLLPKNHGSALFTRGKTQLLVSTTLGSSDDESKIEMLVEEPKVPLMLHYNFLPMSVGEAKPLRAPGRREVGHGYLALNSIKAVVPSKNEFPYTIRLVGDVLSSDGSTSMATVCASTMALMDAGVPIKAMVAGVAMGMIQNSDNKQFHVLTDIAAIEDEFGLMDLKVSGTETMMTAFQMDVKYKGGLERAVFEKALEDAKTARLHILGIMKEVMHEPRKTMSPLVPQFFILKIPKDKIGAVIGSGGKVIREITEKTKTSISIEDSGVVKVFGQAGPLMDLALTIINLIVGNIELGSEFDGIIKKKTDFGFFVELFTGFDGLVHVSSIPRDLQAEFFRKYQEGDKLSVIVVDYDSATGRIRLKIKGEQK